MKRYIPTAVDNRDEFQKQWEEKFGPPQTRIFDSFEDLMSWLKEVDEFEIRDDKAI